MLYPPLDNVWSWQMWAESVNPKTCVPVYLPVSIWRWPRIPTIRWRRPRPRSSISITISWSVSMASIISIFLVFLRQKLIKFRQRIYFFYISWHDSRWNSSRWNNIGARKYWSYSRYRNRNPRNRNLVISWRRLSHILWRLWIIFFFFWTFWGCWGWNFVCWWCWCSSWTCWGWSRCRFCTFNFGFIIL